MDHNLADKISKKITFSLKKDERISSVFIEGSLKHKNVTNFSDVDLWLIFSEESGINSFKEEISKIFSKFGIITGIYDCTAHHFFIVYNDGVQIDLNLITAAQYFSIKNIESEINVLFDRQLYLSGRSVFLKKSKNFYARKLLLVGYATLERALSKFLKCNYFVVVRFLDSIRHNSILPLLPFIENQKIPNAVSLEIEKLSSEVQELFIQTYSKPTRESNIESLRASLNLLGMIASRLEINDFNNQNDKIEKVLNKI